MSFSYGNVAKVSIDATEGGALTDISQYVSSVTPTSDREDVTLARLGGLASARLAGPVTTEIDIEGWWDPTIDEIFESAMSAAAPISRTFTWWPQGDDSGARTYTGEVFVTSYEAETSAEDAASWSATLVVDGAWTQSTVA